MAGDFDGLVAIVTGGGSGIGLATARLLAARGARVAVLDLDPAAAGPRLADREGEPPLPLVAGVTGTVEDNSYEEWRRVLEVNLLGVVRTTRAALPQLRRSSSAAIVNTCSIAATAGLPNRALYSATKGALLSLTLAMAADHVREGIRVNCVTPGTVDTPWVRRLLEGAPDARAELAALRARQPSGRLVSAEEVAAAIAYLASPLAGATVGSVLAVDGGMHGLRPRPAPEGRGW